MLANHNVLYYFSCWRCNFLYNFSSLFLLFLFLYSMSCFIPYLFYFFFIFSNFLSIHFSWRHSLVTSTKVVTNSDFLPVSAAIQFCSEYPLWTSIIGLDTSWKWNLGISLEDCNNELNILYIIAFLFANIWYCSYSINKAKRKKLTVKRAELTQANSDERVLNSSIFTIEIVTK